MNSRYNISPVASLGGNGWALGVGPAGGSLDIFVCFSFLQSPLSIVCLPHPLIQGALPPSLPQPLFTSLYPILVPCSFPTGHTFGVVILEFTLLLLKLKCECKSYLSQKQKHKLYFYSSDQQLNLSKRSIP